MMKKFFILFIALIASASNLFASIEIDGIAYNLKATDQTAEVTKKSEKYSGEVIIPDSITINDTVYTVTSIGSSAFYWCEGLQSIKLPNSLTTINNQAFWGCTGLTSITITPNVKLIGTSAFHSCRSLVSITIPGSATMVENGAFSDCTSLMSIEVEESNPNYSSENGVFFNKDKSVIDRYPAGKQETGYTIPDSVRIIGGDAFSYCKNLTSITIPGSVSLVNFSAFDQCTGLTSIIVEESNPNYSTLNGDLYNKDRTTLVYYPLGKQDTEYIVSDGVTSIGSYAFHGCLKLKSVTLPNSVTSIGGQTFAGCIELKSINIPDGVTEIGNAAFSSCRVLTSIHIPSKITRISGATFSNCDNLTSITIPKGVERIEYQAFHCCSHLQSITCEAINPPSLGSNVFYQVKKSIPLYVPAESIAMYEGAEGWDEFTNILPISDFNPDHPNNPGNYRLTVEAADTLMGYTTGSGLYGQGSTAHIEAVAKDGYEFVKWSDNDSNAVRDIVIARDCTLIADFTKRYYRVQFVNYDGEILQTTQEMYGAIPSYSGSTPVRPASDTNEYAFAGWYPETGPVTQDTIYTARYDTIFLGEETVYVWNKKDISELPVGKKSHIIVSGSGELYVSRPTTVKALTIEKDTACGHVEAIELLTAESIDLVQSFHYERGDISSRWFAFGVPFEVSVAKGISKADSNTPAYYGSDYVIDEYDGVLRADTQDGWKRLSATASLYPGKLYMLSSRETHNWRFTASAPSSVTNSTWSVPIQACPSSFGDHHAGWNGIANPLTYKAYAYASDISYATIYDNYYGVYRVVQMDNHFWKTGDPFFVQTPRNNTVYFAGEGAGISIIDPGDMIGDAPRRMQASENSAPAIIELSDANYADKAFVNTVSDKQDTYTIGKDLEKLQVSNPSVPQVWIEAYGTHLAAYSLSSEMENAPMTLGFYAPTDGTYTLSISNLPSNVSVQLTQNSTSVSDLSSHICEIPLHAGNNTGYALTISKSPEIETGTDAVSDNHILTRKLLRDGQILILRGEKAFTLTGQEVK